KSAFTRVCDALCVAGTLLRGPSPWLWIPSRSAFTRVFDALCAGMSGVWFAVGVDATRLGTCLSAPVRRHYRESMSDLAPAASPTVVAAASARRGESRWRGGARTAVPLRG